MRVRARTVAPATRLFTVHTRRKVARAQGGLARGFGVHVLNEQLAWLFLASKEHTARSIIAGIPEALWGPLGDTTVAHSSASTIVTSRLPSRQMCAWNSKHKSITRNRHGIPVVTRAGGDIALCAFINV